jgi:proteasome lid subunit RPN8/RPN11
LGLELKVSPLKVSKSIFKKIMNEVNESVDKRVIGVLIGKMNKDYLVIDDAVTGEVKREFSTISLTPNAIAKIADEILKGKIKGNIVGWYHTHPGYGVFMSEVDEKTQNVLSQFYPQAISLVLDPASKEYKFYALNDKKRLKPVENNEINFFGSEDISEWKSPSVKMVEKELPELPSPSIRKPLTKRQIYALVLTVILIGALASGFLIWSYSQFSGGLPSIKHTPVSSAVVGSSISLKAEVTGGVGGIANVTVYYEWSKFIKVNSEVSSIQMPWKSALMLLVAAGGNEYAYTIPSSEVLGDIDYFIVAIDKAGNKASTSIQTIKVADFDVSTSIDSITVYLGESASTKILLASINGFSSKVKLSTATPPYGIVVSINPSEVTLSSSSSAAATITVSAQSAPGTFRGSFNLEIYGESGEAKHSTMLTITVPNLDFSIEPKIKTASKGESALYKIILMPSFNFAADVTFSVSGLPDGASWEIVLPQNKLELTNSINLLLKIDVTSKAQSGTYNLTVTVSGGGLKLQETVTLIIK